MLFSFPHIVLTMQLLPVSYEDRQRKEAEMVALSVAERNRTKLEESRILRMQFHKRTIPYVSMSYQVQGNLK